MKMKKIVLSIASMAMLTGCSLGAEILTPDQFKTIYDNEIAATKVTNVLEEANILKYTLAEREIDAKTFRTEIYKLDLSNTSALKDTATSNGKIISVSKGTNSYETRKVTSAAGVEGVYEDILTTGSETIYTIEGAKQQGSNAPILNYSEVELISSEQTIATTSEVTEEMAKFKLSLNPEPIEEEVNEYYIEYGGLYLNIVKEFGKYNVKLDSFPSSWYYGSETFYKKLETEVEGETENVYLGIHKTRADDTQLVAYPYSERSNYTGAKFYVNSLSSTLKNEPMEGSEDLYLIAATKDKKTYGAIGKIANYAEKVVKDTQEITTDFAKFVEDFLAKTETKEIIETLTTSYNTSLELINSTCNSSHKLEILRKASGIAYRICDAGQEIEDFTISKLDEATGTRAIKQRVTRASLTASHIVTYTYEGF